MYGALKYSILFTIWSRCGYKQLSWSEDPTRFSISKDGKLTPVDDRSDFLEERMEMYEEWVYTAKVRHLPYFQVL
jgi:hypothetical protein